MELRELISPKFIKLDLESSTKEDVIKELISIMKRNDIITDENKVFAGAMAREEQGTTGVGKGVAIPHVKSDAVKRPAVAFGKSKTGIDYGSLDGKLTKIFFLITVPEESDEQHLKILAKLSRRLVHKEFREQLLHAETPEEVMEVIEGETGN